MWKLECCYVFTERGTLMQFVGDHDVSTSSSDAGLDGEGYRTFIE